MESPVRKALAGQPAPDTGTCPSTEEGSWDGAGFGEGVRGGTGHAEAAVTATLMASSIQESRGFSFPNIQISGINFVFLLGLDGKTKHLFNFFLLTG